MEMPQVVEVLLAWSERHRLEEKAAAQFEQWLNSRGGSVGDFSRSEIQVALFDQLLVFHGGQYATQPMVVTCLALAVYDGECPLGTFKLLTDLDGQQCGIVVELGAEVALEGLGGNVWRYYE
jgi:hypothetical protein